jgi:hypothetical protein
MKIIIKQLLFYQFNHFITPVLALHLSLSSHTLFTNKGSPLQNFIIFRNIFGFLWLGTILPFAFLVTLILVAYTLALLGHDFLTYL